MDDFTPQDAVSRFDQSFPKCPITHNQPAMSQITNPNRFQTFPLPVARARLHLMHHPWPEPGCFEQLAAAGIRQVVSLLETQEANRLDLAREALWCQNAGMDFTHLPVTDHHTPPDINTFARQAEACHRALQAGHDVAVHCFAGIGRTGLLAAAILMREGLGVDQALLRLTRARGVRMPETRSQIQWLHHYQETIHP